MAIIKIVSVKKREVAVDVTWDNGINRFFTVPNVPVEEMAQAQAMMRDYISSMYSGVMAEEARKAYENPVIDPAILAAVGKSFNDDGTLVK